MKPTEKQKRIIKELVDEIKSTGNTNDIDSPSHHTLQDEFISHLEDIFEYEFKEDFKGSEKLSGAMGEILDVIKANR